MKVKIASDNMIFFFPLYRENTQEAGIATRIEIETASNAVFKLFPSPWRNSSPLLLIPIVRSSWYDSKFTCCGIHRSGRVVKSEDELMDMIINQRNGAMI
jgi:hypothetical protein